jgi:large subunit ribosomal protein L35
MPKMKTKRAAAKRFSKTATGKLKFKRRGLRHILTKHSSGSKRPLRKPGYVDSSDQYRLAKALPYL